MTKTLLVTGGASGIGAATARLAASRGYAVAVNYRTRRAAAARLVDEIRRSGGTAIAAEADVTDADAIERLFGTVEEQLGAVSALVNSAGISLGSTCVSDVDVASLERLMKINVVGLMICCREATRRMSTAHGGNGGVIVNVSSMAATIGGRPGSSHYAASKAAVDAFTLGFAKEVAEEGIRVLSVRPGFTATEMTEQRLSDAQTARAIAATIPMGRIADASEVAAPIVWLVSDEASFMTGACIDISGGGFRIQRA
jgi:NAD(P)-dependent dehydrogenase (short-subunit alcohol dehydrogenase family)